MAAAGQQATQVIPGFTQRAEHLCEPTPPRLAFLDKVAVGRCAQAWIEQWEEHFQGQIDQQEEDAQRHHQVSDERTITAINGLQQCLPHARPNEERFDHRQAGEREAKRGAQSGQHGNPDVAQGVAQEDATVAEALAVGDANVILAEHISEGEIGHLYDLR